MHSSLAVTVEGIPLGLAAIKFWTRKKFKGTNALKQHINPTRIPIETKESYRWLENLKQSTKLLDMPSRCVHIGDRESDIFELFERVPDEKTHLIVRASHDRKLATDEKISERLANGSVMGTHEVELPAITGKRQARTANLEIKYTQLELCRGHSDESLNIFCISAAYFFSTTRRFNFMVGVSSSSSAISICSMR